MKFKDIIAALCMLPSSRAHLLKVTLQLKNSSFTDIISQKIKVENDKKNTTAIVKSYFWACRSIPQCNCLPRSIALYQRLKANGFDVKHKFGANKNNKKFAAHAWVEYNNSPLNESKELLENFQTLTNNEK